MLPPFTSLVGLIASGLFVINDSIADNIQGNLVSLLTYKIKQPVYYGCSILLVTNTIGNVSVAVTSRHVNELNNKEAIIC